MALKTLLFFCFDILNLELFEFQRLQVMEKLYSNGNLKKRLVVCRRVVVAWEPDVRTFEVCLRQKSRDITCEIERRKGELEGQRLLEKLTAKIKLRQFPSLNF